MVSHHTHVNTMALSTGPMERGRWAGALEPPLVYHSHNGKSRSTNVFISSDSMNNKTKKNGYQADRKVNKENNQTHRLQSFPCKVTQRPRTQNFANTTCTCLFTTLELQLRGRRHSLRGYDHHKYYHGLPLMPKAITTASLAFK